MPRFIVLPRESNDAFAGLSAEEMEEIIGRYLAWSARTAESGHLEGGEKLEDGTGRVVRASGDGIAVTDGPFAEVKEVVGGFWIVKADDWDAAQALMEGHPHLEFGSLEIRRIEEYDHP